jgi:hypothetical protein
MEVRFQASAALIPGKELLGTAEMSSKLNTFTL